MQPRHIALALAVAFFWGLNFVLIKVALTDIPPFFLAALRFAVAAVPVLFLPKPPVGWRMMVAISGTLFLGQFAFLFPAMTVGLPAGLASIGLQIQVFMTIGIAAVVLDETPTKRQIAGGAVALAGLILVGMTVGSNGVTVAGFVLLLLSALAWAIGNVLLRRAGQVDMSSMIAWLSLLPPIPFLLLSLIFEGPGRIADAVAGTTWVTVGAVLYIGVVSTTFGYAGWGHLLKLYPAATAAPFSLLVPVSGTLSAALLLGETFGPVRLAGMVLIFVGLGILVLRFGRKAEPTEPVEGLPDGG